MCKQTKTFDYIWKHCGRTTSDTQTRKYMPTIGKIDTTDVIMMAHFTGAIWHHRTKIHLQDKLTRVVMSTDHSYLRNNVVAKTLIIPYYKQSKFSS